MFARQTLLRIHERSGGNPFFALELARQLAEDLDPLQPLPVPERLDELLRARLAGLPAATHEALALAAALGTPSESLLERAGVAPGALEPAVAAHVIERDHGAIRFTHPLLSSVLYQDLGRQRRTFTGGSRTSSRTPSPAPVTWRCRAKCRTRSSPAQWTPPQRSRPSAVHPPSRPSSPSTRCGCHRPTTPTSAVVAP